MENISKMKTMKLSVILLITTFAVACGQKADDTFDKVMTFNYGFRFSPTGQIYTSLPSVGSTYWNDVLSKPLTFPPIAHTHDYDIDLTNKPGTIELQTAISQLWGFLPPRYTTVQINAFTLPIEEGLEVYDLTLHVKKYWNGTIWKIFPTTN